nr:hypothetical protein [Tanacetum cinerariifolium]
MVAFFILDKLTEIAGSNRLLCLSKNRRLIADLKALGHCTDAVRSLGYLREMVGRDSKTLGVLEQLLARAENRRLIADLKALGHCTDAVRSLGYLREMVGRDSKTLGVLEQLLARAEVGSRLKAGYADGMEKTE